MIINKTVTEYKNIEMDINIPYYCKSPESDSFHCVKGDDNVIKVILSIGGNFVGIIKSSLSAFGDKIGTGLECTEQEFTNAYNSALKEISKP